jgi:hypothetical protein
VPMGRSGGGTSSTGFQSGSTSSVYSDRRKGPRRPPAGRAPASSGRGGRSVRRTFLGDESAFPRSHSSGNRTRFIHPRLPAGARMKQVEDVEQPGTVDRLPLASVDLGIDPPRNAIRQAFRRVGRPFGGDADLSDAEADFPNAEARRILGREAGTCFPKRSPACRRRRWDPDKASPPERSLRRRRTVRNPLRPPS